MEALACLKPAAVLLSVLSAALAIALLVLAAIALTLRWLNRTEHAAKRDELQRAGLDAVRPSRRNLVDFTVLDRKASR